MIPFALSRPDAKRWVVSKGNDSLPLSFDTRSLPAGTIALRTNGRLCAPIR